VNDAASLSSYQLPDWLKVEDAAVRAVPTRFKTAELLAHCRDVEVLLRLNPYYFFKCWTKTGESTAHIELQNKSNEQDVSVDIEIVPGPRDGMTINYSEGVKLRTLLLIEPAPPTDDPKGPRSLLVLVDDYGRYPEAERKERLPEVDKSLLAWAEALRVYFIRQKRWSWLPGWRWYIRRVWIRMNPSARRIVWWIYIISVVEFFFFLFVLAVYVLEQYNDKI
jgi:hypothetical protein